MKITKIILSLFLLFTYSLGIAHNIIPHQHDDGSHQHVSENHHNHGHEHHSSNIAHTDHHHISHGDHFDENMYELLLCFLHQSENHENDCKKQHYTPSKTYRSLTSKNKTSSFESTLCDNTFPIKTTEFSINFFNPAKRPPKLLLNSCSTLRGPPPHIA